MAARVLDKQVRPGRPLKLQGLAEATGGPAFATCAGLLAYAIRQPIEARVALAAPGINHRSGRLARLGRWLRESL
jgi:cell division protein FtsA